MKKVVSKAFCLLLLMAAITSCVIPTTKKTYLNNFSRFVTDVEKNGDKFSLSDWQYANKRFGKYSGEWYDKFSEELNSQESSEINELKFRYKVARGKNKFARFFKDDMGKDLDKIKDDVEEYMKEDFRQDMRELSKGAREIGDSAKKVVEDIIKEKKQKE